MNTFSLVCDAVILQEGKDILRISLEANIGVGRRSHPRGSSLQRILRETFLKQPWKFHQPLGHERTYGKLLSAYVYNAIHTNSNALVAHQQTHSDLEGQ